MYTRLIYIVLVILMPVFTQAQQLPYNLSEQKALQLPDTLREISGITMISKELIACVQDENGILFIYDLSKNKIHKQILFASNGDYEELAKVGKTIYVLRSDGTIFEIKNYDDKKRSVSSYTTEITASNNEGLCYDEPNNRLLVGCKNKAEKGPLYKNKRFIYSFDLETKHMLQEPAFVFNTDSIKHFITQHNIPIPLNSKKKHHRLEPVLKFRISAICIHPISRQLYVLSAVDYLLMVFNRDGSIETLALLDPKTFNKAEGITFSENGDMLISNEGQKGKPTLLRFNYLLK